MEKDVGKIKKNDSTDIIIRIDDFGGKIGLTIREFTTGDRYTGFTKSGTRIPVEQFKDFKDLINSIDESELATMQPSPEAIERSKNFLANKQAKKPTSGEEMEF